MTDVPVKAISEIEEKSEVSVNDKILILDSVSEEARLASKSELKWDKWDPWDDGAPWADGAAATVTVGTTTTWSAGTSASVTNSGTSSAAVLNFVIPKWADGSNGSAASVTVGTTTTLPAWSSATVTNSGTSSAAVLNFGIPKWDSGEGSGDVLWPNGSTDGDVVLFDGSTGKQLKDSGVKLGTAASKDTGTSSGNVPVLDSNWKLATSTLPWVALTDTYTVSTSSDLTSLSSADQWDIAIVTSENKTYVLSVAPYSTAANWKEILAPTGWVTSVNGSTWAVTVSEFTPWGTATTGYVVKKTADWYEWAAESWAVTSVNGNTGAVTVTEFTPSGTATTGYVVTKTAWGYEWAAPSGWIENVTTWTTTTITGIWAGTEAEYWDITTPSASVLYFTF